MYHTYLKKNEDDHGGAPRRASSGMAHAIGTKPLTGQVHYRLVECAVEGLF